MYSKLNFIVPRTRIYKAYENAAAALFKKTGVRGLIRYSDELANLTEPSEIQIDDKCRDLMKMIAINNESVTNFLEGKDPWQLNSNEIEYYFELTKQIEPLKKKKKGKNDENWSLEESFIAVNEDLKSSSQTLI